MAVDPETVTLMGTYRVGVMRVQKQRYRDWITAGGTPPIYT